MSILKLNKKDITIMSSPRANKDCFLVNIKKDYVIRVKAAFEEEMVLLELLAEPPSKILIEDDLLLSC